METTLTAGSQMPPWLQNLVTKLKMTGRDAKVGAQNSAANFTGGMADLLNMSASGYQQMVGNPGVGAGLSGTARAPLTDSSPASQRTQHALESLGDLGINFGLGAAPKALGAAKTGGANFLESLTNPIEGIGGPAAQRGAVTIPGMSPSTAYGGGSSRLSPLAQQIADADAFKLAQAQQSASTGNNLRNIATEGDSTLKALVDQARAESESSIRVGKGALDRAIDENATRALVDIKHPVTPPVPVRPPLTAETPIAPVPPVATPAATATPAAPMSVLKQTGRALGAGIPGAAGTYWGGPIIGGMAADHFNQADGLPSTSYSELIQILAGNPPPQGGGEAAGPFGSSVPPLDYGAEPPAGTVPQSFPTSQTSVPATPEGVQPGAPVAPSAAGQMAGPEPMSELQSIISMLPGKGQGAAIPPATSSTDPNIMEMIRSILSNKQGQSATPATPENKKHWYSGIGRAPEEGEGGIKGLLAGISDAIAGRSIRTGPTAERQMRQKLMAMQLSQMQNQFSPQEQFALQLLTGQMERGNRRDDRRAALNDERGGIDPATAMSVQLLNEERRDNRNFKQQKELQASSAESQLARAQLAQTGKTIGQDKFQQDFVKSNPWMFDAQTLSALVGIPVQQAAIDAYLQGKSGALPPEVAAMLSSMTSRAGQSTVAGKQPIKAVH